MSRDAICDTLRGSDSEAVSYALFSAALHDNDLTWVEEGCLHYLDSAEVQIRYAAIVSLGHLARIHRRLSNAPLICARLEMLRSDPELGGAASNALDDIAVFIPAGGLL